jgi:hypothetical protein
MSPRDKALKAQIKKKEALKKEKAKQAAENERQRKIGECAREAKRKNEHTHETYIEHVCS